MKKGFALFCCGLLFGCGYFENDGFETVEKITGRFEIVRDKTQPENFQLEFKNSENSWVGIGSNCKQLVYDSINKKIFFREELNQSNSAYKAVIIKDLKTDNILEAYDTKNITEETYNSKLKDCKNCIIKNY